ncbi:DNA-directed RNA polymerase subunit beta [Nocardia terpenica]|uniref:DNA-directed RNA polymerase subunit beta n=1 Tax=Nocardia terpenica TaxID=455432 RepID=UPI001895FABE|nr:DNA-directed RNA polymerase subunit beta [Nocardia terpenica]MBF6062997.1 DNA-directed RNA polymerase subunit beta [Nocardia terpenica]MBF6104868.1 DNA-directed RNA polymerase subunit beta [Nocardia terpenica]MBF6112695.1 DNA-directed RNA polymerase subunit beta [Nocardia terpenica]MBF6118596.1 DNA-directed RNA polymerase subunit beta [Nocardia terpenica]MBF6155075.1 DNA-directed RNA polymerase subunit beta [Nocardia terpenica]
MDHSPVVGDTPESRSTYYRTQCGLAVVVKPGGTIVVKAGGSLAALTMPVELGCAVKVELDARNVSCGPIVAHTRSRRWTFLVDWIPALDPGASLDAEMMRANVMVIRTGGEIALPSPASSAIERQWVYNPGTFCRPSADAVLKIIRHCARVRAAWNAQGAVWLPR